MSIFNMFHVAGSALTAQSVRLNAVASNMANADSITSADGTPYLMTQRTDTTEPDHKVVAALPRGLVMLTLNRRRLYDQVEA